MYTTMLASLCLLPLAVSALPSPRPRDTTGLVTLPFTKTPRTSTALRSRQITTQLDNQAFDYTINITIGTPPQSFTLVLDTGSSDVWVYSAESSSSCSTCTDQYYNPASSSTEKQLTDLGVFNITYGTPDSGVLGYYALDVVTVSDVSVQQTIGVATKAGSGDPPGGIFGVGLSQGESIAAHGGQPYPGYIDSLSQAGLIKSRAYSIALNAPTPDSSNTGVLIIGGTDSSKYTGDLVAFPLVEPAPDGDYRLDIDAPTTTFSLDGQSVAIPQASGYTVLLDTGTAISRIPIAQFIPIAEAVGAQQIEAGSPIFAVDCSLADASGSVDFAFAGPDGSVTISVPWTELVLPDPQELPAGYCAFGLAPEAGSAQLGFYILGDTFLRSAYVYYDFDNSSISLAQANY